MKKHTLTVLREMLINAQAREQDNDFMVRMDEREEVRKIKARIAKKERAILLKEIQPIQEL